VILLTKISIRISQFPSDMVKTAKFVETNVLPVLKKAQAEAAKNSNGATGKMGQGPGESEPGPAKVTAPKSKRRISPEGLKRIIAATKRRWRLQKAATKASKRKGPARKAA